MDDVEYLCYSLPSADTTWLRLLKTGRELPGRAYQDHDGGVDIRAVRRALAEGFTLQLSRLHKRSLPVGELCRALEREMMRDGVLLSDRIGAHAYLTPPGTQGLNVHSDYQDVFVLQIQGEKQWTVWEWTANLPISQNFAPVDRASLPPIKATFTLRAGDVLYIPRGVYHEASTSDSLSLHVSLSIYPLTWSDVMGKLIATSVFGRTAMSKGCSIVLDDACGYVAAELANVLTARNLSDALASLRYELLGKLASLPHPAHSLLSGSASNMEPPVESSLWRWSLEPLLLVEEGDSVILSWQGGGLRGRGEMARVLKRITGAEHFKTSDISLGEGARDSLLSTLREGGLICLAS